MTGKELKELRQIMKLSQEELAEKLGGISNRTIAMWESKDEDIDSIKVKFEVALETLVKNIVEQDISSKLFQMNEEAAHKIHAEGSWIWLREKMDKEDILILYKNSSYPLGGPLTVMNLSDYGLTAFMVRNPGVYNLTGGEILNHPSKKFKHSTNMYLPSKECVSLLCVPLWRPDSKESDKKDVIGILKIENKLDDSKGFPIPISSQKDKVFSIENENNAKSLAKGFANEIFPLIKMFL